MPHYHLCWELGGGLGHAGRLSIIADALLARGHQVSLSVRDLAQTHGVLAALDVPVLQAPVWLHRTEGLPSNHGSLAEILLTCGYLEAKALTGLVAGWRAMFRQLKPDVVVADYAPTAVLAARSMGLRSASVGVGFSMPPRAQPLPCLRAWEKIAPQRLAAAEERVLQTANAVLTRHNAAPFAFAADLLLGDRALLTTWPELDHYGRSGPIAPPGGADAAADGVEWYGPAFLPGAGEAPCWPEGDGPKVFAYLKTAHAGHVEALAALAQAGCRVLCYLPEVAGGKPPPLTAPNLAYASSPVSLQAALSQAQLCVCHGGEGTVASSLLAGVPLLLLPMQLEQFLCARRVAGAGMGVNSAMLTQPLDWSQLVRHMLATAGYARAARAFAARHHGYSAAGMAARLARALELSV
ncbi:glycosyltransferase [Pseudoduganella sp. LjRoot289]|uniref:glycosyltransferase n=1 Tax=Pseudoduganella sp. LjRoot289 TaxID=3342314 RepID=UPI003ECED628